MKLEPICHIFGIVQASFELWDNGEHQSSEDFCEEMEEIISNALREKKRTQASIARAVWTWIDSKGIQHDNEAVRRMNTMLSFIAEIHQIY